MFLKRVCELKFKEAVLLKAFTFRGGIHPDDCKKSTKDNKIIEISPSKMMVYPVVQHIGVPCVPIVKVGGDVLKGQKIADSDAFVSAPIHSSVSGKVIAIEKRRHPNGNMVESIVVENDNLYRLSPDIYRRDGIDRLTKDESSKSYARQELWVSAVRLFRRISSLIRAKK